MMKNRTKAALVLGLVACTFLVVFNMDFLQSRSLSSSFLSRPFGKADTSSNSQSDPASGITPKKGQKRKTPKRNRSPLSQDADITELGHSSELSSAQISDPFPFQRTPTRGILKTRSSALDTKDSSHGEGGGDIAKMGSPDMTIKQADVNIQAGEYPDWWTEAWPRSIVSALQDQFVGDQPLFGPCTTKPLRSTYGYVEPLDYFPSKVCKNPCWYTIPSASKGLRCVPYVYLAGVAKCGTTDIAKRLRMHPEVFGGTQKEYHWWERNRFGSYDEDNPERKGGESFSEYTQEITGNGIIDLQQELQDTGASVRIFGDYSPSYLWDPQKWNVMDGNQGCQEPRVVAGHHIRHVYPPAKIIMTFRHPTPRLYSRFMSRIHRTPDLKKATTSDFHRYVAKGIKLYMACFRKWSIRHCAYNGTVYRASMVRLVEGMYPVFMADWLRIWPKDQMYFLRYEDYGGHERERITELIDFLELRTLSKAEMDILMELEVANPGTEDYAKHGDMLPETKKLLDDFYQPFIQQFAQLLNDDRFLWKDVYQ